MRNSTIWANNSAKRDSERKKLETSERKTSISQMKNAMESITNGLDLEEERILGIEGKVEGLSHSDSNRKKISNHDYNIQDL
jgi:hypothetical protein